MTAATPDDVVGRACLGAIRRPGSKRMTLRAGSPAASAGAHAGAASTPSAWSSPPAAMQWRALAQGARHTGQGGGRVRREAPTGDCLRRLIRRSLRTHGLRRGGWSPQPSSAGVAVTNSETVFRRRNTRGTSIHSESAQDPNGVIALIKTPFFLNS